MVSAVVLPRRRARDVPARQRRAAARPGGRLAAARRAARDRRSAPASIVTVGSFFFVQPLIDVARVGRPNVAARSRLPGAARPPARRQLRLSAAAQVRRAGRPNGAAATAALIAKIARHATTRREGERRDVRARRSCARRTRATAAARRGPAERLQRRDGVVAASRNAAERAQRRDRGERHGDEEQVERDAVGAAGSRRTPRGRRAGPERLDVPPAHSFAPGSDGPSMLSAFSDERGRWRHSPGSGTRAFRLVTDRGKRDLRRPVADRQPDDAGGRDARPSAST